MKLHDAIKLAERIKGVLAPFCERIEIAGSIRRARPHVNDIDLVVLPKDETGLRATLRKCPVVTDGKQMMVVKSREGIQIDVWFAHNGTGDMFAQEPSNWGSLLLCRTGSKEHNVHLCQLAQKLGLKWETSRGLVKTEDGGQRTEVIASLTEEEIFRALGMEFVPPAMRERQRTEGGGLKTEGPVWADSFSTQEEGATEDGGRRSEVSTAVQQLAGALHDTIAHIKQTHARGFVRLPGGTAAFID